MYRRHDELPVLSSWPSAIEARTYNPAARALKRAGTALRLDLPDLYRMDLILQPDAWVVVDSAAGDMPIAAWVNLVAPPERGLHEPVPCDLRYFHAAAGKVVSLLRANLPGVLEARLDDPADTAGPRVIPFPQEGQTPD